MEPLIQSNPIALSLLVPGLISAVLGLYALISGRVIGSRTFAALMFALFVWSVAYGGELASLRLEGMLFWTFLEYLGIATVPVLWLLLVLLYTGREESVTVRNVILLFIVPAVTIIMVGTNQFHHLFYSSVTVDTGGPFPMMSLTKGPWSWVHTVYSYVTILIGIVLLSERLLQQSVIYRKQIAAMLIGSVVPWVFNILYQIFGFMPLQHLDVTPYSFTITGIVVAWAMYRYQLLDLVPVARDRVVENMDDGMIFLDSKDRVVDANKSAHRILGWTDSVIGKPAGAMLARWPALLEIARAKGTVTAELQKNDKLAGSKCFDVSVSDFANRPNQMVGRVILLHDVTDRKQIEDELKENEEKYHSFFKTTRDAVFMTTMDGHWLEVNAAAAEMFGYDSVEEMLKIPVVDVYGESKQRGYFTDAIASRGFVKDMPVTFRRKDGRLIAALLTAVALRDKTGKVTGFQGTAKDVTEMKQAEEALMQANEQLQESLLSAKLRNREITLLGEMAQWIQSSKDMGAAYQGAAEYMGKLFQADSGFIAEIDTNNQTVEVRAFFGKPVGRTVFPASDCIALQQMKVHESDGSDASGICPHMDSFRGCSISIPLITAGGVSWLLQVRHGQEDFVLPASCHEWLESRRPLLLSAGQELSVALSNIRLRETLHDQAIRDPLTGLFNRRYMEEMLELQLHRARRTGSSIGFIMADLDFFKNFNDSYGHAAGDLLLTSVANQIRKVIRLEDIACRYGGEEFLIILPYAGLKDTRTRALQIREEIRNISFLYEGQQLGHVTISMGVSAFPDNGDDASMLVKTADQAMYEAKKGGRDRVVIAAL
jgi:diguanylate cyclase (GGDEF)-like protein/PAS domain S-box-containing protein